MAQSMQEIVRTEAGIEPSDRGDGSVSHLFTAGGLTVQACAQPSTGDALRNQAQPAQRLHVFSYCIEHRSCGRARIRSNVEYMVGVLCLLGRFSGMVGPRRTSARQPARRSIGGQLVYAPSRGRVLRRRDRSTLSPPYPTTSTLWPSTSTPTARGTCRRYSRARARYL